MTVTRTTEFETDPLFVARWSPRVFDGSAIPENHIGSMLEAARWAPSAYNIQPWRFMYALRDDENWETMLKCLNPFNRGWAQTSSAIFILVSDSIVPGDGKDRPDQPANCNSLDAGSAWVQLALQATKLGYHAHGMAGVEPEIIRERLQVPERFKIEMAIAVGRRVPDKELTDEQKAAEKPSERKPIGEIAFRGAFPDV